MLGLCPDFGVNRMQKEGLAFRRLMAQGVGCVGEGDRYRLAAVGWVCGSEVPTLRAVGVNPSCVWDPSNTTPSPLRGRGFLRIIILLLF